VTHPEAAQFNGRTILAQQFALDHGTHEEWREGEARGRPADPEGSVI
jgi:hypothetical protein